MHIMHTIAKIKTTIICDIESIRDPKLEKITKSLISSGNVLLYTPT